MKNNYPYRTFDFGGGSGKSYDPSYNNPYNQSANNSQTSPYDNYSANLNGGSSNSGGNDYDKYINQTAQMQGLAGLGGLGIGIGTFIAGLDQNSKRGDRPKLFTSQGLTQAYNDAYANKDIGFTPQEQYAFNNNVNTANRTTAQQIQDQSGGQSAQATAGQLGANTLNAYNQYAVGDANQRRANKEQFYNQAQNLQQQENANQKSLIDYYDRNTDRTGATITSGLNNIGDSVSKLAPLLALL
jgi:hypothetical protein